MLAVDAVIAELKKQSKPVTTPEEIAQVWIFKVTWFYPIITQQCQDNSITQSPTFEAFFSLLEIWKIPPPGIEPLQWNMVS